LFARGRGKGASVAQNPRNRAFPDFRQCSHIGKRNRHLPSRLSPTPIWQRCQIYLVPDSKLQYVFWQRCQIYRRWKMTRSAAVIGLGSMGMGMARTLLGHGWEVTGCDVRAESRDVFQGHGGQVQSEPAAAVA